MSFLASIIFMLWILKVLFSINDRFTYILLWGFFLLNIYGIKMCRDSDSTGFLIFRYVCAIISMFALPVYTWILGSGIF